MGLGIPIIDRLLGIGEKVFDRVVPDSNKRADQAHERSGKQADATLEGERNKNYFTPRAILLYGLTFIILYGIVIQPFAKAFGLDLPTVDFTPALRILLGLLGLDLTAG
ncbi:MAG: hypothetical protein KG075_09610 [Alphaproteobacteria bacterium]|nr:hypothetical protein [Alphaproteobacteria bacterium]